MNLPTQDQVQAAKRMGVDLRFTETPLAVARLCEIIERPAEADC